MGLDSRLLDLLERWESLCDQGKLVPPEELCRDCPDLLEEVKRRIDDLLALKAKLNTNVEAGASSAVPWPDAEVAARSLEGCPRVPGYEILGVLGRGGMGVVYKARHFQFKPGLLSWSPARREA